MQPAFLRASFGFNLDETTAGEASWGAAAVPAWSVMMNRTDAAK